MTFGEFAEQWLAAQTFSETTWGATELRLLLHALPTLGPHELRAIKQSFVQACLRDLGGRWRQPTCR